MKPARGKLFVKHIETDETLLNGRIILTEATRDLITACQMMVVAVGAPEWCDQEGCERLHVLDTTRQGKNVPTHRCTLSLEDWVLLRHRSLVETHREDLYCCNQSDVLAILRQD